MSIHSGGKARAWIGAVIVHIALVAVLIFSVRWKQQPAEMVVVDIVAPPSKTQPVQPSPPPEPPAPEPPPPPKSALPPEPVKPVVRPPADIAREKALIEKQRQEKLAEDVAAKKEAAKKEQLTKEAAKKDADKKLADTRTKELASVQERATKELKDQRAAQERLVREKEVVDRINREATENMAAQQRADAADRAAKDAVAAKARSRAEGDYVAKIRGKIKGNIILANDPTGNPEAVFEVNQLPTGEVIDVRLTKSSGNPAYDQAVERAILKSSPLPKPDTPEIFQRRLTLKFRPIE